MARSKFNWLIVFEDGITQFAKAQTIWQIIDSGELIEDSDSIINITKMNLTYDGDYEDSKNVIDIPFQD
jgi:hypothetical protein